MQVSMNPDHRYEFVKEELEELFKNLNFEKFNVIPIGFIRLGFLEIVNIPKFLTRYSDQIMVIAVK